MSELSARAKQILYAAITEFVATGEPVGSRTLSKKCGIELSPASIRNVLSDLEEAGYLQQPHTSAGRVPTDRAFRLFIDALMEVRALSQEEHARIRARFEEMTPGHNMMRETGRFLSELTGAVAVVVSPRLEALTLKQLRFLRTNPGELLAVLVMSNGSVQNRFISAQVSDAELTRIHNLLDDVTDGRTLGDLRDFFARKLATERIQQDQLRRRAFSLAEAAVSETPPTEADVVIEGQSKLFDRPEFSDAAGMKQLVSAFDDRERLLRLLDATMAAKGPTVMVGQEAGELGGGQLAIVRAPFLDHGRTVGTIGIIGPTRMDYPKVVPLVEATASAMTEYMDRSSGGGSGSGSMK
ncbi:heat-inducible transcriptional repressor HrcA [Pendulispora brunnea]|uniref:Heat-inducible transcription repressor HrcA n=1 Tax=Pendulispora brunnea TaxID=2905690 RepID=A0ABZ2KF15_9BACT